MMSFLINNAGTVLTASGCGIPVLSSLGGGYIFTYLNASV